MFWFGNSCIGCRSYSKESLYYMDLHPNCGRNISNKRNSCPCCKCVIKVMCTASCDDLSLHTNKNRSFLDMYHRYKWLRKLL
jgi:hypothetical protein